MTSPHPNAQVPTPESPAPVRVVQPSKLRDSCHACALSKVKCHKDKPTCSRCARRGITCEYFTTKRPGRKRDSRQSTNNRGNSDKVNAMKSAVPDGRQNLWPVVTTSTTNPTLSDSNDYLTPPDLGLASPRPGNVSGFGPSSPTIFMMPLESSLSSAIAGMSNEFDDFSTSSMDFLELERFDSNFAQGGNDIANILIPDDINPDLISDIALGDRTNTSKPSSPSSNGHPLSTTDTSVSGALDLTCCCSTQILDLMKKLPSTKPQVCASLDGPYNAMTTFNVGHLNSSSAQTVVMDNQETIETISNILQCTCAEDCYLLTMLSMIILKVLGRYAAAAQIQPKGASEGIEKPNDSTKGQMQKLSNYCPNDEDLKRMAAQLILSELHRVQRLVNQLSPKLKTCGMGPVSKGGGSYGVNNTGGDGQRSSLSDGETTIVSFSASTLDNIETDLRKYLSTLSSELINILRQS